jgi:hypothetical protein
MTKKKINKKTVTKEKGVKEVENEKKVAVEEEPEKEGGTLSDGVLDAFDEVAPADILLEEETLLAEEDEDEIDSGDYKANDEW